MVHGEPRLPGFITFCTKTDGRTVSTGCVVGRTMSSCKMKNVQSNMKCTEFEGVGNGTDCAGGRHTVTNWASAALPNESTRACRRACGDDGRHAAGVAAAAACCCATSTMTLRSSVFSASSLSASWRAFAYCSLSFNACRPRQAPNRVDAVSSGYHCRCRTVQKPLLGTAKLVRNPPLQNVVCNSTESTHMKWREVENEAFLIAGGMHARRKACMQEHGKAQT